MSWFKIDDSFHAHPKVKSIPRKDRAAAVGLWTMAGSWASQQLTDGFVPEYMLDEFGVSPRFASALVSARLWIVNDEMPGWNFHDWDVHQPSRETVQERRKKNAERIAAWRAAKTGSGNTVTSPLQERATETFGNDRVAPPPTRPDPTRPDPTLLKEEKTGPAPRGTRLSEDWNPSPQLIEKAQTDFPTVDLRAETEAFRDWFLAAAGKGSTKVDWGRAWQGWMRRTHATNTSNQPRNGYGRPAPNYRMLG